MLIISGLQRSQTDRQNLQACPWAKRLKPVTASKSNKL